MCELVFACTRLKKPEPLLESGHDLAVTHRHSERRGGGGDSRKNKPELSPLGGGREGDWEAPGADCGSSTLILRKASVVFTG